jgi:hypothetical protein
MIYEVQLVVKNKFGKFLGSKAILESDKYDVLVKMSKTFYSTGGFELTCDDGSYVIFPPEIVQKSILIINKKIISEQSEEQEKNNNDVQEQI